VPVLTVIAGPNGSGKSSFTRRMDFEGRGNLLDPDALARNINAPNPRDAAISAARLALTRTRDYLLHGTSFAVETTLSGRGNMKLMAEAHSCGYQIHLVFIALGSPEKCIARIRTRAERGEHFVPDVEVRRRYARSLANLIEAIRLADIAEVFDNSGDGHRAILVARAGVIVWRAARMPRWAEVLSILEQNQ
jgi:predicted ABC-type ATPase